MMTIKPKKTANLSYRLVRVLSLIVFLSLAQVGVAAKLPFTNYVNGAAVQVTSPTPVNYTVSEDQFASLPGTPGFVNTAVVNRVTVGVDHASTVYVGTAYKYRFKLQLDVWDNTATLSTSTIYLNVMYDPAATGPYEDKSVYTFTGGHKVKVSILEIFDLNTSTTITNPPDNIIVKSDIDVERYYTFTSSSTVCPSHVAYDLDGNSVYDQITISWSMITGAEEYDLEWTYVDDYDNTLMSFKSLSAISWNFRGNSTRVSTANTFYKVNLVYDRGYIIYRVRGVGRNTTTPAIYIYGDWSKPESGTNPGSGACPSSYYAVAAHTGDMNWQYTATYAEEGKKKEVVGYFDGSLRGRQTVTVNNTDNNAIAGESYYDYQGRKAVDALPVPTGSSVLGYKPNFNLNTSLNRYSKLDFDPDAAGGGCLAQPGPMSNTAGSSKYYSPNNPQNTGNNAYIPDAAQYPFSQVEYTPDNTGRIRSMGGVGSTHQLGTGKETRYYYGQPLPKELDRLFGSEVGYSNHYKKNMVIDPNGQVSISYLDMHGRVVATALSGSTPSNVTTLPNTGSVTTVTDDLLGLDANGTSLNNVANAYLNSIEFNSQVLVSNPGNHVFDYSITIPQVTESCMSGSLCFDCAYNLDIKITDECGNILHHTSSYVGPPSLNTTCSTAIVFPASPAPVTLNLGIGNYRVSKTLTIDMEAYEYYLTQYLDTNQNTCMKSYYEMLVEERAAIDYNNCNYTCQRCVQLLGSKDEYVLSGTGTEADWEEAYDECMAPCREPSPCEVMYNMMLADVSPGGQYGEWYDSTINKINVKNFPLSLFNYDNLLADGGVSSGSAGGAFWRNPELPGGSLGYYEDDGVTKTRIPLIQVGTDIFEPAVIGGTTYVFGSLSTGYYTYPQYLEKIEDFLSRWQRSWAASLVRFHPEYCYHTWCVENLDAQYDAGVMTSTEFENELRNTLSYADAVSKGYIISSNTDPYTLIDLDPYFDYYNMQTGVNQKTLMQAKCSTYTTVGVTSYSLKEAAAITAKCGTFYGTNYASSCTDFTTGSTDEKDRMWQIYRDLYISYKQTLCNSAADDYTLSGASCNGYNGCIGTDNFNPFGTRMRSFGVSTIMNSSSQPCGYGTYWLYKSKTRRFLIGNQTMLTLDPDKIGFSYYYNTGQCPNERDLFGFLAEIAEKQELTSTHDLHSYASFTPNLYTLLTGNTPGGTFQVYETVPTVSMLDPDLITIALRLQSTSTYATCDIKMRLLNNVSAYSWSQVVGIERVKLSNKDAVSGQSTYTLYVLIDHDANPATAPVKLAAKLTTCVDMGDCAFNDQCRITDYANSMFVLMSALAEDGLLTSTSTVAVETLYTGYLNRYIRNEVGGSLYTNLRWQYTPAGSNTFVLKDPSTLPAGTDITITFSSYNPGSFTNADLPKIKYFENFQIDPNNLQHGFIIDAWYEPSVGAPLQKVTITGSFSSGFAADCYDPVPTECDVPEVQALRDLEALVSETLAPSPAGSVNLTDNNLFTALLESYVGKGETAVMSAPAYTNDRLTTYITVKNGSEVLNTCKLELYRINEAYETLNDFNDITAIENLQASTLEIVDGKTFYFTADVTFSSGLTETVGGYTSCIPLKSCGCEEENTSTCTQVRHGLTDNISQYNTNYTQTNPSSYTVESLPDISHFDCECARKYQAYLVAYTNTAAAPMSYTEYQTTVCAPNGDFESLCPQYNDYIIAVNAYNAAFPATPPTLSIIPYGSAFPCGCIETYVEYLSMFSSASPPAPYTGTPMDIEAFQAAGCTLPDLPGGDDGCEATARSMFDAEIAKYNAYVVPPSGSMPGAPLPNSPAPGPGDCQCAIKYVAYLERYLNYAALSPAFISASGLPGPEDFGTFKSNGCQGSVCIDQYYQYYSHATNCGLVPASFDPNKCNCYLNYAFYLNSHHDDIVNGTFIPLDLDSYCNGSMMMMASYGGGGVSFEMDTVWHTDTIWTEGEGGGMQIKTRYELVEKEYTAEEQPIETMAMMRSLDETLERTVRVHCAPADSVVFDSMTMKNTCFDHLDDVAELNARYRYNRQIQELSTRFLQAYLEKCLNPVESFTLQYPSLDYHYTLYYYDQGGNLVRTVPPEGVSVVTSGTDLAQINTDRTNNKRSFYTKHRLTTTYEYNSLNQLVRQSVPDHNLMNRWNVYNRSTGISSGLSVADMNFIDANVGYLVGNNTNGAELYRTRDGGITWSRLNIETPDLRKVQMIDASNGFAVGMGCLFFYTTDGGANWQAIQVNNASTNTFNDLYFKDASNGILVGDGGMCYRAAYSGGAWSFYSTTSFGSSRNLLSVSFLSANDGFVTVDNAGSPEIFKCTTWPAGTTIFSFTNQTIDTKLRAADIKRSYMVSSTSGYAVGVDGQVLKTTNSGSNWTHIATGMTVTFKDIYFKDMNNGIALADDGKFYTTTNAAVTWTAASAIGTYNAMHIFDKSTGSGFAIGEDCIFATIIYQSSKGFRVFKTSIYNPVTDDFNAVFGLNSNQCIVGGNGTLYSIDFNGGDYKMTDITGSMSGENIVKLYYNSSTFGGIITASGKFYKAVYSGSWTYTDVTPASTPAAKIKDLDYDASNVYPISVPATGTTAIVYSTPASSFSSFGTHQTLTMSVAQELENVHLVTGTTNVISTGLNGALFVNATDNSKKTKPTILRTIKAIPSTSTIYAAGSDGIFIKTTNSGTDWQTLPSGTAKDFYNMDAASASEVYASGNSGTILKHNGSTNTLLTTGTNENLRSIVRYSTAHLAVVGENRTCLLSSNNGSSWTSLVLPKTISDASAVYGVHANGSNIFIAAPEGIMYKYSGSFTLGYIVPRAANRMRIKSSVGVGAIACNNGTLISTLDNGQSWQLRPVVANIGSNPVNSVCVVNKDVVMVVANSNFCRKWNPHTNAFTSVSGLAPSPLPNYKDICFNDNGEGVMIGAGTGINAGKGYILRSTNSGGLWSYGIIASKTYTSVDVNDRYAYITGTGKELVYFTDFTTATLTSPSTVNVSSGSGTPPASDYQRVSMIDNYTGYVTGTSGVIVKIIPGASNIPEQLLETSDVGGANTANTLYAVHYNRKGSAIIGGASGYVRTIDDDANTISGLFWYDELGRMVVSQNTRQFNKVTKAYSYTLYDALGRITEVGEVANSTAPESNIIVYNLDYAATATWVAGGTRTEVTSTYYDAATITPVGASLTQTNLRKRVASVSYEETYDGNSSTYDHATHYSYDVHGNVYEMVQDVPALSGVNNAYKHITYEYDLVSGKVNAVHYSSGNMDQFHHRYTYDADNRIVQVETSRDNINWDKDAHYYYYAHGPLMRSEIGDLQVQGMDFAYTLHGWLKGVNAGQLQAINDMGKDGYNSGGNPNKYVARDAFGFTLGYYAGDYTAINSSGTNHFEAIAAPTCDLMVNRNDLYNGNISSMQTALPEVTSYSGSKVISNQTFGNAYKYDQLNRLLSSRTFTNLNTVTNTWGTGGGVPTAFATDYTYDANGNIMTQKRNGSSTAVSMEDLSYRYQTDGSGNKMSNRLYLVNDAVGTTATYTDDIEDQGSFNNTASTINTANNYGYDEIGNLIRDTKEEIASIEWTVYGKIKKVNRTITSTRPALEFTYDASGNRLTKKVTPVSGITKTYYYLRDAQGNEMAHYEKYTSASSHSIFECTEHLIYGSSRVGEDTRHDTLYDNGNTSYSTTYTKRMLGNKSYECANHLGNVLATVTDQRIPKSTGGVTIDTYDPVIVSITDYYPFGTPMPTMVWSSAAYRYGFNGKEKDNEINVDGGDYDYGARIYDSRLGRWLSLDPLMEKYLDLSPYNYCANNPLLLVDPDGATIDRTHSVGLRQFKRALKSTPMGRAVWKAMKKAPTVITVIVTDDLMVAPYPTTGGVLMFGMLDGQTAGIPPVRQPQNAWEENAIRKTDDVTESGPDVFLDKATVFVSLGNIRMYQAYEQVNGTSWYSATLAAQNAWIAAYINANPNINVSLIGDGLTTFPAAKLVNLSAAQRALVTVAPPSAIPPISNPSTQAMPLDFETQEEFVNRVGTHEGTHALNNGRQQMLRRGTPEDQPNNNERQTIEEQKNNRNKP